MAKTTLKDDEVTLGPGTESNSLFANGGTALVIHAKADDYKTDPAGNSGDARRRVTGGLRGRRPEPDGQFFFTAII